MTDFGVECRHQLAGNKGSGRAFYIMKSAFNQEKTLAELLEDTAAARRRRKVLALTLLAVVVILLIVAIFWWRSLPNEDDAFLAERPVAPVALTGAELMEAYENDPALDEFAEGPVLVTAPLATTPISGTTVLLRTADPLMDIAADVDPTDATRLADVERGTEVAFLCERIAPGLRAPSLEGCSLALELP